MQGVVVNFNDPTYIEIVLIVLLPTRYDLDFFPSSPTQSQLVNNVANPNCTPLLINRAMRFNNATHMAQHISL